MEGLVLAKSNAQMMAEEREQAEEQDRIDQQRRESVKTSLAGHVRRQFEVMRRHKEPVEQRMLDNLRQVSGRYSAQKEAEITQQGLPLIFMQLTSVKCRAAKSWIRDVLMPAGDRPWQLDPTKDPSLSPSEESYIAKRVQMDAQQFYQMTGQQITPDQMRQKFEEVRDQINNQREKAADRKMSRMADEIEDQLVDGGWGTVFDEVISDVVDFPAGIMKAPVMRRRKELKYTQTERGNATLRPEHVIAPEVERVDPFRFYIMPGVTTPDDGDCAEIHEFTPDDLYDLIGLPGYEEAAIRRVLQRYEGVGYSHWHRQSLRSERDRARGQFSGTQDQEELIEVLEFWGSVRGQHLLDWGMLEDEIPDPDAMHDVMVMQIEDEVIAVRFNPDPLGRKPYAKACFENVPGAFWGKGVPDLIKDTQDICNAAARALVANMGISSGPQVAVNSASLEPGQDVESMYPWKIWQLDYTKTGASTRPPVEFFQPSSVTQELMAVYKEFAELADEYSGIPSYSYGMDSAGSGAAGTASGLSMLMNAASKAIKNVIKHIDQGVIVPVVHRMYVYNMLWNPDDSLKGDAQVVARGAMTLVAKEQNQMRLQELLAQTANPMDMQIIGSDGRATLLRHAFQGVDVGGDNVVPSEEELQRRMQMQNAMAAQQGEGEQQGQQQGQQNGSGGAQGGGNGGQGRSSSAEQRPDGNKSGVQTA